MDEFKVIKKWLIIEVFSTHNGHKKLSSVKSGCETWMSSKIFGIHLIPWQMMKTTDIAVLIIVSCNSLNASVCEGDLILVQFIRLAVFAKNGTLEFSDFTSSGIL